MSRVRIGERLRRVEGQVRGIARMVDERRYSPEILAQLSAVRGALDEVERILLRGHLRALLGKLTRTTDSAERERRIAAILSALGRAPHRARPPVAVGPSRGGFDDERATSEGTTTKGAQR